MARFKKIIYGNDVLEVSYDLLNSLKFKKKFILIIYYKF